MKTLKLDGTTCVSVFRFFIAKFKWAHDIECFTLYWHGVLFHKVVLCGIVSMAEPVFCLDVRRQWERVKRWVQQCNHWVFWPFVYLAFCIREWLKGGKAMFWVALTSLYYPLPPLASTKGVVDCITTAQTGSYIFQNSNRDDVFASFS
jgi:hypothetical protein